MSQATLDLVVFGVYFVVTVVLVAALERRRRR